MRDIPRDRFQLRVWGTVGEPVSTSLKAHYKRNEATTRHIRAQVIRDGHAISENFWESRLRADVKSSLEEDYSL